MSRRRMLHRCVTNSERSTFACEKKWYFKYLEGLSSFDAAAPLRQGTLWHYVMAAIYRSGFDCASKEVLPYLLADQVVGPWLEQREHYVEKLYEGNQELIITKQAEDGELAKQIGAMAFGYVQHWYEADLEHLEVIAVEPQFARWIPHPHKEGLFIEDRPKMGGSRRRRRWCYGGAVDAIVLDRRTGLYWILEHKTTKDRKLDQYMRKLHWDPQVRGYKWALENPIPELSDIKEPIQIAGVLYNVARKKVPSIPEPIKDGSRLSKGACDTTRDMYRAAIDAAGFDPGDYADVLNNLPGWEAFFARETYPLTAGDSADFEKDMSEHALIMLERARADYHPRQVQICLGGVKSLGCEFSDICLEDGNMARAGFRVMTIRHPELRDDLAEPVVAQERGLTLAEDGAPGRHPGRQVAEIIDPAGIYNMGDYGTPPDDALPEEDLGWTGDESLDSEDPWGDLVT